MRVKGWLALDVIRRGGISLAQHRISAALKRRCAGSSAKARRDFWALELAWRDRRLGRSFYHCTFPLKKSESLDHVKSALASYFRGGRSKGIASLTTEEVSELIG